MFDDTVTAGETADDLFETFPNTLRTGVTSTGMMTGCCNGQDQEGFVAFGVDVVARARLALVSFSSNSGSTE